MAGKQAVFPAGIAVVVITAALGVAPAASAAPTDPSWNGWYRITFHTDQKTGTSTAAQQSETPYTAWYEFSTDCSSGTCVATATDGPTPKDNVPKATSFEWTGSQWSRSNSWRWDCQLGDGTVTFDPAKSVTTYAPQADGSLTGTFATNIGSGACEGTVYIPLTAAPATPGS